MKNPSIAILRWESGHVPAGLLQLEQMPGNSKRTVLKDYVGNVITHEIMRRY